MARRPKRRREKHFGGLLVGYHRYLTQSQLRTLPASRRTFGGAGCAQFFRGWSEEKGVLQMSKKAIRYATLVAAPLAWAIATMQPASAAEPVVVGFTSLGFFVPALAEARDGA